MSGKPEVLASLLEPAAIAQLGTDNTTVLHASIAVSLKRIADRLECPDPYGELTRLMWEFGDQFGRGMRS
jgi:hypothetical protein